MSAQPLVRALALAAGLAALAAPATANTALPYASEPMVPTRLRFIPDNNQAWYARWYLLGRAEQSIAITYFNFYDDLFGKALLGRVLEKAREGVEIRLMVDSRGSLKLSRRAFAQRYLRELARYPNVRVKIFKAMHKGLKVLPKDVRQVIASNHDKIMLVDGEWAIVGGRNLGSAYYTDPADDPHAYRDNDLLMKGSEVAAQVERAFSVEFDHLENYQVKKRGGFWRKDPEPDPELDLARDVMDAWLRGDELPEPAESTHPKLVAKLVQEMSRHTRLRGYQAFVSDPWQGDRVYPTRVLDKRSFGDPANSITANLMRLFDEAQESILIQNPYLVLTRKAFDALQRAGRRGVQVTILTNSPASSNSLLTQAFFLRDWKYLLRDIPGLRIHMAVNGRKHHAKTFVIDGRHTIVGSYNMDPMSETINSEVMTLVESESFGAEVAARIQQDIALGVEASIRIVDGEPVKVVGPEDYLEGWAGFLIKVVSKLKFLRPLV